MTKRTVERGTFTIERVYDAPPARVFEAFADPAVKRRWFIDGEGWHTDSYETDFKSGGYERSKFRFGDGPPIENNTTYLDIVENERIIFAYDMVIDGKRISASFVTIEFFAEKEGTRLAFSENDAFLDGLDDAKSREAGTRELLDNLGRELAGELTA